MKKRHHRTGNGSGRSILFVLICIFGGAATEIAAQELLASGSRVRVTASDCALSGQAATFRALRADTLFLETTQCPLASVTRLDVSIGRKRHALLGAGIGFAAGALVAVVACNGGECVIGEGDDDCCDEDLTGVFAFFLGLAGGGVGAITGYFIKTDLWEEIPLERLRLGLAPQRDGGFALGFSVRF